MLCEQYHIAAQYTYDEYPANPNGSTAAIAALECRWPSFSDDATPRAKHIPWQCGYYPEERRDEVTYGSPCLPTSRLAHQEVNSCIWGMGRE